MFFDDEPMGGMPADGGMSDGGSSMPADDSEEKKEEGSAPAEM